MDESRRSVLKAAAGLLAVPFCGKAAAASAIKDSRLGWQLQAIERIIQDTFQHTGSSYRLELLRRVVDCPTVATKEHPHDTRHYSQHYAKMLVVPNDGSVVDNIVVFAKNARLKFDADIEKFIFDKLCSPYDVRTTALGGSFGPTVTAVIENEEEIEICGYWDYGFEVAAGARIPAFTLRNNEWLATPKGWKITAAESLS